MTSGTLRIYLRRSREDHQHHSIDTQREGAMAFADDPLRSLPGAPASWGTVVEYQDDDSGGEWLGRAGYQRLLAESVSGDTVICRDISRLGRETLQAAQTVVTLIQRDVRLFFYAEMTECHARTPEDILLLAMKAYAPHKERDAIRSRTREALRSRFMKGRVAGGCCYGYRNVRKTDEMGRGYTVREIEPEEAEVVRKIFAWRAEGDSPREIAKRLNDQGVPSPYAGRRGTGTWSHTAIRPMLSSTRYRGLERHGEWIKVDRGGRRVRTRAPEKDVLKLATPHLRIVTDEVWARVQPAKRDSRKAGNGRVPGHQPNRKHPFSVIGRCGTCGGSMMVGNSKDGKERRLVYMCSWHRDRGNAVCDNKLRRPKDLVEATVAEYLLDQVLTERMADEVVRRVRERLLARGDDGEAKQAALATQLRTLEGEIAQLVNVIATRPDSMALVAGLTERERRHKALTQELALLRQTPKAIAAQIRHLEDEARARLATLRGVFQAEQRAACRVVEALFPSGLTFTPTEVGGKRRYAIKGDAVVGPGLLRGANDDVILVGVPSGV